MVGYREFSNPIHDGTLVLKYRPQDIQHQERLLGVLGDWSGAIAVCKPEPRSTEVEAQAFYWDGNAEFLAILPDEAAARHFLKALKYLYLDPELIWLIGTLAPIWEFSGNPQDGNGERLVRALESYFPDLPEEELKWLRYI